MQRNAAGSTVPPLSLQVQLLSELFWTYSEAERRQVFDSTTWTLSLISHPAGSAGGQAQCARAGKSDVQIVRVVQR